MEGSIYEVPHNSSFNLQTLKRNNKKCGKEEVFCLVQESV